MAESRTAGAERVRGDTEVFELGPHGSWVGVRARSNVGEISFGSGEVTGHAAVALAGGDLASALPVTVWLQIPVDSLDSGNPLYNAELRSRMHVRDFPLITVALREWRVLGPARYAVEGDVSIHRKTRRLAGAVTLERVDDATLLVRGDERLDLRDFAIEMPFPNVLLLKIYPDVQVDFALALRRRAEPLPAGDPRWRQKIRSAGRVTVRHREGEWEDVTENQPRSL